MKFGSKKAIFGAIWEGFEGFGPCLGISHPTHPHLGKISQKKRFFFIPSLSYDALYLVAIVDENLFSRLQNPFSSQGVYVSKSGAHRWISLSEMLANFSILGMVKNIIWRNMEYHYNDEDKSLKTPQHQFPTLWF